MLEAQAAVWQNRAFRVSLTNYTKQGVPFTNNLDIIPIDAVASDQSYFYATSHITRHPDASTKSESDWVAPEAPNTSYIDGGGYVDPLAPPGQPMLAPDPNVYFREGTAAERALKRFHREEALARYVAKRKKRIGSAAESRPRSSRQKKHESRQAIAYSRPRVRGRFIKTGVSVNYGNDECDDTDSASLPIDAASGLASGAHAVATDY